MLDVPADAGTAARRRPRRARALPRPDARRRLRARTDDPSCSPSAGDIVLGHRRGAARRSGRPATRRGGDPARDVFDAAARRGPVGDRAAGRRQHRHRRRPGRACCAGSPSCSRRGGRVVVDLAPPGTGLRRPATCALERRRADVGAVPVVGGRRRRDRGLAAGRRASPWSHARPARRPLVRRAARRRRERRAAVPERARLPLPAAQPRGRRAGRAWLGICFGVCLRHRADQPLAQPDLPPLPFPTPARRGATGSPRACTCHRHRGGPAAAGQALDGLPASCSTRPPGAAARAGPRTVLERGSHRGAGGGRDLPARHRAGQLGAVVPVVLLASGPPTTRSPGSRSARWSCTSPSSCRSSGGALERRRRGRRRTTDRAPTAAGRPDRAAACCARPGSPPGSRCSPPPAAPCRGCARSRSSGCGPATGPQGIPINKSARAAGVTATATEPGVPPRRRVRRPASCR